MSNYSISYYITKFRSKKNILMLFKGIFLIFQQRRTLELIYGIFCRLFYKPSSVKRGCCSYLQDQISSRAGTFFFESEFLSRSELVKVFSKDFDVNSLPNDFARCRRESIIHSNKLLIVGEYGQNASRIFYVTKEACITVDYYNHVSGVRHIHLIHKHEGSGEFLISTGDSKKLLDLWIIADGNIKFVRRIKKYMAGYTGAAMVNGKIFFGTDFSSRPNYIETLEGEKFFFPAKAYNQWVVAFHSVLNRYIFSINAEAKPAGGKKTLSVFDVFKGEFVFCDYVDSLAKSSSAYLPN